MEHINHNIVDNIPRLQWSCRRGMLELDILLGNYLKEVYPTLSLENKNIFIQLLNYPDPDILAWLLGEVRPNDPLLITMIEAIRHHAQP